MSSYRCTIKQNGRTLASESASSANDSDAAAKNAALMKTTSKVDLDEYSEVQLSCEKM